MCSATGTNGYKVWTSGCPAAPAFLKDRRPRVTSVERLAPPGWGRGTRELLVLKGSKNGAPPCLCTELMLSKCFVQTEQGAVCLLRTWISYSRLFRGKLIKAAVLGTPLPPNRFGGSVTGRGGGCTSTWYLQAGCRFCGPQWSPETVCL